MPSRLKVFTLLVFAATLIGCGKKEPAEPTAPGITPSGLRSELLSGDRADAGLLAVRDARGRIFWTSHAQGRAAVHVSFQGADELLWETDSNQSMEIAGLIGGEELLLVFVDEPVTGPADLWRPGLGYYGLDIEAAGVGVYPSHLENETRKQVLQLLK